MLIELAIVLIILASGVSSVVTRLYLGKRLISTKTRNEMCDFLCMYLDPEKRGKSNYYLEMTARRLLNAVDLNLHIKMMEQIKKKKPTLEKTPDEKTAREMAGVEALHISKRRPEDNLFDDNSTAHQHFSKIANSTD